MTTPPPNPWKTLSGKQIYDNPWIRLREDKVLTPAGKEGIYGVIHFKNMAIGIVAIDEEENTWLIGQHRYPFDEYTWEIPEGGGPLDIAPLDSAKRELLEEAGIKAGKWTLIQEMQISNCCSDEVAFIYLAEDLSFHAPQPDDNEQLAIRKLPFQEAYEMVLNGEMRDSLTVAGILRAKVVLDTRKA